MKRILSIIALVLLCSCSPKIIERVRTEYVYRDRVQVDTTFIHDSTFVKEYVKGDTIRITEYKDRYVYQYKYLSKVDTVIVRDSIAIEHIKEVKVEKPLSWFKRAKLAAFWWLLAALGGCLVWIFRKPLMGVIKSLLSVV